MHSALTRRAFVRSVAVLVLAFTAVYAGPVWSQRPNVVIILADDLGYGDLSSYGATDLKSPNIDGLLEAGLRFDSFYANCPVCSPTRASLLTGRYPELVGVPGVIRTHPENSWGYLAPDAVLLPELLGEAGYRTALVGKWHLGLEAGHRPNDRGFDFFHGFLGDMMDDYYDHRRHGNNYMRRNRDVIDPEGHATDLFTDWACRFIETSVGGDQPFFLYLAYNAPHTPIQPPEEWVERVVEREPGIDPGRARLVALIEHMDAGIGRVWETIRETGVERETLILFTSDNGGQLNVGANNGPWRDGKQSMYEGGLRVPASATWPGVVDAGSRTDYIAITMDLFPTVLDVAGVDVPENVDGRTLLPVLQGDPGDRSPRDLFFHRREGGRRYGGLTIQAVRRGPWKLLQNSPFAPMELYHLERDPQETTNVLDQERATAQELEAALRRQIQRGGRVPWQPPDQAP